MRVPGLGASGSSRLCAAAFAVAPGPPRAWRRSFREPRRTGRLAAAARANPQAIKYLLDPESLPEAMPSGYRLGTEEEAIILADSLIVAWHATAGAVEWLREHRRKAKKVREQGRKKRGRR